MTSRKLVTTLLGILASIAIALLLWQFFALPLAIMLEQLGVEIKIVSIGLLSATCFFFWRITSGQINQQVLSHSDIYVEYKMLVFIIAMLFALGVGSLLGLFLNGLGFLIGLVSGSSFGYQIGFKALSVIYQRRIPPLLPILFSFIPLFGVIVILSLYLAISLGVVFVNLIVGLILGSFIRYISMIISNLNKVVSLTTIICFSLLFVTYVL